MRERSTAWHCDDDSLRWQLLLLSQLNNTYTHTHAHSQMACDVSFGTGHYCIGVDRDKTISSNWHIILSIAKTGPNQNTRMTANVPKWWMIIVQSATPWKREYGIAFLVRLILLFVIKIISDFTTSTSIFSYHSWFCNYLSYIVYIIYNFYNKPT